MKKSNIVIICIVIFILIIAMIMIGTYNGMISKKEAVDSSVSNLDVMLQRRADLIPNLVSTVKGYTSHENEVIEKITTAREKLLGAKTVDDMSSANDELTSALNNLFVIVENYPDLKSSENFINLQDELAGTENRIAVSRKDYNDAVNSYNTAIKKFPTNILAGMFGFDKKEYFETSEGKDEVPEVSF